MHTFWQIKDVWEFLGTHPFKTWDLFLLPLNLGL